MKELDIKDQELIDDIIKQMSYTYAHRVKYKNYIIAQDQNEIFNDIIVLKDGKEIFHSSNSKQFTTKELKKYLLNVIKFIGGEEQCHVEKEEKVEEEDK